MLNIGKLAPGGEGYYLSTVASGVEDYYTGVGEAPGYWLGTATPVLGLAGEVDPADLRAVLAATHPASGQPLTGRASRRTVPGFDCTLRAPKSVALLYGLADPATSRQVRDAHDAAVAAALGYLESHAAYSRRGHAGAQRVAVDGLVAAAFRHRTSRAGDPLLHTHVLVANVGCAVDDGRWRTLDGRGLYVHAKTAGYLYQAQLRAELTRRLGVAWGEIENGCADLDGIPDKVIRAFSQRRAAIEAHMAERGDTSAKAAQVATLATRRAKDPTVTPAALGAQWTARAAALGFGPHQVAALTERTRFAEPTGDDLRAIAGHLAGPDGLTARASTFTRRDAIQSWCEQLPAGADTDTVLAYTDRLLADDHGAVVPLDHAAATTRQTSGDAIRRADGTVAPAAGDEARYSTPELLAVEQRTVDGAVARQHAGAGVATAEAVETALATRPSLSAEQQMMVRQLVSSGAGVEVVVGKAGAGKTFALDAARAAWQASGHQVIGAALAARAAAELSDGAGIPATTLDGLLYQLDKPLQAGGGLPPRSVVVVDEAGMVGTRKLARLLDHATDAQAKIVLVGDHHQLPEIDAGGVFHGLTHRLPPVELTDNRRQHHQWQRDALDELRTGDPHAAITAMQEHGRVVAGDNAEAVREQLVADWWHARELDHRGVMIAARSSDVADLNDRARTRMAAAGHLTGPTLETADGRAFQAGDEIVCLRNDRSLGVINGTRATVTSVDPDTRTLAVHTAGHQRELVLPGDYLDAGHLTHSYAITGHKAQGLTTDQAWVLGSEACYREWGYVALSRSRHATHLYIVNAEHEGDHVDAHGHTDPPPPLDAFSHAMQRRRAQHLAIDQSDPPTALPERQDSDHQMGLGRLHRLAEQRDAAVAQLTAAEQRLAQATSGHGQRSKLRRLLGRDQTRDARCDVARLAGDVNEWRTRAERLDAELEALQATNVARYTNGQPDTGTNGRSVRRQGKSSPAREASIDLEIA